MILDDYIPQKELAAELGITVQTLLNWRRDGKAPPRTKIGQRVVYYRPSVRRWLVERERQSNPECRSHAA